MIQYPMTFEVFASSNSGIQSVWTSGSGSAGDGSGHDSAHLTSTAVMPAPVPVTCAIPPEFDGPGGGYSPEDIYAMALANCFIATFKVFAEKSSLEFGRIDISLKLDVDRDEKGQPWMARAGFAIQLNGVKAENSDKAQRILDRVSKSCMILNSVRTEKSFHFQMVPGCES